MPNLFLQYGPSDGTLGAMKDIGALRSTGWIANSTARRYRACSHFGAARRLACLLTLLAIAASTIWPIGLAAQTLHFSLSPDNIQVETGDEFEVAVIIRDAGDQIADLYGIQLDLSFDPVILQVVDADPSRSGIQMVLGDFPFPDFVALHEVDNLEGRVSYACTQMPPREPVSGSGTALAIRFQATGSGTTALMLQGVLAANQDAIELDVTTSPGQVVVVQPAPTATPTSYSPGTDTQAPTRTPLPTHTSPASLATATATTTPTPQTPTSSPSDTDGYPAPIKTAVPTATPTSTPTPTPEVIAQPSPEPTADIDESPPDETEPSEIPPIQVPTEIIAETATLPAPPEAAAAPIVEEPSPTEDAVVALVAPRAPDESAPPPERGKRPLVSTEVFVCLSAVLVLFTALLILYVAKRQRRPSRSSLR